MVNNYTQNSLIKYLYQEVDVCEKIETEFAIENDVAISNEFKSFQDTKNLLPEANLAPTALTLQKIKMYSLVGNVQLN